MGLYTRLKYRAASHWHGISVSAVLSSRILYSSRSWFRYPLRFPCHGAGTFMIVRRGSIGSRKIRKRLTQTLSILLVTVAPLRIGGFLYSISVVLGTSYKNDLASDFSYWRYGTNRIPRQKYITAGNRGKVYRTPKWSSFILGPPITFPLAYSALNCSVNISTTTTVQCAATDEFN